MERFVIARVSKWSASREEYLYIDPNGGEPIWMFEILHNCLWYTAPGDILGFWKGSYLRKVELVLGEKI